MNSSDFPLYHADVLKQHVAILGKTGSGKTYAAKGAVEQLLTSNVPVVVLDPTSAWWGLRLAKDGKTPMHKHLVVINGRHGDVTLPLTPAHAVKLAQAIYEHQLSVVIDIADASVGERTRFASAFAEKLYRVYQTPRPLHLVIDEAHEFAPQQGPGTIEANEMLHNFRRLGSGGRSRGLRLMMITQRPAKLHKDVLTCAETLVAMKVIASQDRQAVADWIDGCGDKAKARMVLDSLANLKRGQGWVWSPECEIGPVNLSMPAIATFDSSATPDGAGPAVKLETLDLAMLQQQLAEVESEAPVTTHDVKALKKRIAMLEEEISRTARAASEAALDIEAARREGGEQVRRILAEQLGPIFSDIERLAEFVQRVSTTTTRAKGAVFEPILSIDPKKPGPGPLQSAPPPAAKRGPTSYAESGPGPREAESAKRGPGSGSELSGSALKLIGALNWWKKYADEQHPSRAMVASIAGYSPAGGHFSNVLSECGKLGLVGRNGDQLHLTPRGQAVHVHMPEHRSSFDAVRALCDGSQARVLDAIISKPFQTLRFAIAQEAGFAPNGGHFNNVLSSLRQMGVITTTSTHIQRAAWLRK